MRQTDPALVQAVLIRDGGRCSMCGAAATTANHRADRGMGGFKGADRPSNLCAICGLCNGLIESSADAATEARARGVKISRYDDPESVPYLSPLFGLRVLLHDDWSLNFFTDEEP